MFHVLYPPNSQAVIYALNSGADYQFAGPLHLAGDACSWRTPLAKDIQFGKVCKKKHDGFEEFKVSNALRNLNFFSHTHCGYLVQCLWNFQA